MAIVHAVKNGNWDTADTWDTNSVPTVGDEVYANGFTVYITSDISADSISTNSLGGIVEGGFFSVQWASPSTTPQTITVTADIWASPTADGLTSSVDSLAKKLVIIGDLHAGNSDPLVSPGQMGARVTHPCEIYGNVYGGAGLLSVGAGLVNAGTDLAPGELMISKVVGNIYAGESGPGVANQGQFLAVSGHAFSSPEGTFPIAGWSFGPLVGGSMQMTIHTFDYDSGVLGPQVTFTIDGGGGGAPGEGLPATSDVRAGVAFGTSLVGTLAVPSPNQVAFGVPVDATTGQAAIDLSQLSTITGTQIASAFEK